MADISQITISSGASRIADEIMETGFFKDKVDVLTYAAGYTIKNHFSFFDPTLYTLADSGGSNFASGTFDPERKWHTVIKALYEDTDTPYLLLRALMDKGLYLIKHREIDEPDFSVMGELI